MQAPTWSGIDTLPEFNRDILQKKILFPNSEQKSRLSIAAVT